MHVEDRLSELGLTLPVAAAPAANYVPYIICQGVVHISGQLPMADGSLTFQGKVGQNISEDNAIKAAQLCGLNIIAQLKAACDGDLGRVQRIILLGGFVNCVDGFEKQPAIINGASDLMVAAFGERGRHARAAVGTNALPFNAPVEIDAIAFID
mgnify:FL=1